MYVFFNDKKLKRQKELKRQKKKLNVLICIEFGLYLKKL